MKAFSYTIIPSTQQGVENSAYNGTDLNFNSEAVKAAGYYSKFRELQTISWHFNNFVGKMVIEATLETDPSTENYFEITPTIEGTTLAPNNDNASLNIEGKFSWIRASIKDFGAGAITKISVSY